MLKKLLPILCLILLIALPPASQAQSDTADQLIIANGGDFWSWSEAEGLTRLTDTGNRYYYDRSPDGRYLVYARYDDRVLEAFAREEYFPTEVYPTNIEVYDLETGEATTIASQPAEMVYTSLDVVGYDRFNPSWSPDGSKIAWIQLPLGMPDERGWQLVIYDVGQGVAEVINDDLPGPFGDAGFVGLIGLRWKAIGLITSTFGGAEGNFFGRAFRIYDEAGTLLAQHYLTVAEDLYPWFWSDEANALIGFGWLYETETEAYVRLDPFAETVDILSDQMPVTISSSAPTQLMYQVQADGNVLRWWMPDSTSFNEISGTNTLGARVALHADGQQIAYFTDALYIWHDGETQRIPDTEQFTERGSNPSLLWGDTTLVIIPQTAIPSVEE